MKIYTRTGDKGKTSLMDGKRVSKADVRVEAYGTVDELNSSIGVVVAHCNASEKVLKTELIKIQHDLFELGSALSAPGMQRSEKRVKHLVSREKDFETLIDNLTKELPPLKNFILPGGGKAGTFLHVARSLCRRAERRIVLLNQKEPVDQAILIYFNRLSDLLFTFARFANKQEKKKETLWKPAH